MTKKRVLSGCTPSGKLHIGNYFGSIKPNIDYQDSADLFYFISNLHALTTTPDPELLRQRTLDVAIDYLACGLDPDKCTFWAQSDVPEVTELAWILNNLTPMGLMERAHAFKDKTSKGLQANLGLFTYPVLMAADILMPLAEVVPVGKDQKQHVEMTRDIAIKFNSTYGELFPLPEPEIPEEVAVIPGIDGQKMSKSYSNTIPLFGTEKEVQKAVMSIVTDSAGVEDKKDPEESVIYQLYKLFGSDEENKAFAEKFTKGGTGYGDLKKELLEMINSTFEPFNKKRAELESNPKEVEAILTKGADKLRKVTNETMRKVREMTGLNY